MIGRGSWSAAAHLPYLLIIGLTLVLAAAPQWVRLPVPGMAVELTEATVSLNGQREELVALPHRWPRSLEFGPAKAAYRVTIERSSPGELYLLIPAAQHDLTVEYDGIRLPGAELKPWGEPAVGSAYMLPLPSTGTGAATIVIMLERESGSVAGYLSRLYLADGEQVAGVRWVWSIASSGTRVAVAALQALVVLGIATVWLARRRDPIFGWLFAIGIGSLAYTMLGFMSVRPMMTNGQSYMVFTLGCFGLMAVGLAQAITGTPRRRWLKISIVALPVTLIVVVTVGILPPLVGALISSMVAIAGHLVAAWLLFRNSLQVREWDRALLAVPFFLTGWYGLRDIAIVVGAIDGVLLLSSRIRPVTVVMVLTLLMRRLASSLDELDIANETLRERLAAREAELSALHAKERARTAQTAREDERGRLMRDLHDGLSGHLVSIIALSEAEDGNPRAIERAARAALDDLRLVVNSLDLDDGDLLLALAGLRERLEPQLRRLGFDLDWSMENLPQVSGVTPGNALSILRILQEGITNALKHGHERRIAVLGSRSSDGWAVLSIRNRTAGGSAPGRGHGIRNMKRRAGELGGSVSFDAGDDGAILTLRLPPHLEEG